MREGHGLPAWWGLDHSKPLSLGEFRAAALADMDSVNDALSGPAKRLVALSHFAGNSWLLQQERADWRGVDPRLAAFAAMFVEAMRRQGVPLFVHCARRGREEQEAAFKGGFSRVRWPNGEHNKGGAVDIIHGVHGWGLERNEWAWLHAHGLRVLDTLNRSLRGPKLELRWGGNFSRLYDPAHWEIVGHVGEALKDGPPLRRTPWAILKEARCSGLTR